MTLETAEPSVDTLDPEVLERGRKAMLGGWSVAGKSTNVVITRAQGSKVWDADGNEYVDLTSQAWSNNIGASDPRVIDAAHRQAQQLSHLRSNYDSIPLLRLADRLTAAAPAGLDKVSFSLHGSLAIETAIKLAFKNSDIPGPVLALHDAYHGRSFAGMGLSWPHAERKFDSFIPPVIRVRAPYAYRAPDGVSAEEWAERCAEDLRSAIQAEKTHTPSAFIMEPVQGNGTQADFPRSYYERVREICTQEGVYLIFDEIQTGFGRTGKMWAAEYYGVTPDILAFGKGAGGGYPLAGVLARGDFIGFASGDDALTFGQFPPSLAAGLATLDVIESDGLLENCTQMGAHATARLLEMQERHPLIGDVRGPGLLIGVELVLDRATKEPAYDETQAVYDRGLERGVIFGETKYSRLGNVVKVKPPLSISRDELDSALDAFDAIVTELEQERGL